MMVLRRAMNMKKRTKKKKDKDSERRRRRVDKARDCDRRNGQNKA